MKNPLIIVTSVMSAMLVTLGLWFAPTHGQANEDLAQLVEVTVLDDAGNAVPNAGISLQRMRGTDATNVRRGGATNGAGERSIEMPVEQGRYRIVLDVPQGYSEDRDDADDTDPGPNAECAGITRRCVLLDVDATGTVTVTAPLRGANPTAITFHVTRDLKPALLTVTQTDQGGNAVPGGTFVMQPYTIVQVGGQDVRQWGRVSRTGMTTASRTFRVEPNTSYSIRWEPPEGWLKVSPGAPGFGYEITTGPHGTTTKAFVVRKPAAPGGSSTQLGGSDSAASNTTGTPTPVTPEPVEPAETPELPEPVAPAPVETPEQTTPSELPEQTTPSEPQQDPAPSGGSQDAQGSVIPDTTDDTSVPVATTPSTSAGNSPDVSGAVADETPETTPSIPTENAVIAADEMEPTEVDVSVPVSSVVDVELQAELAAELEAELAAGMDLDLEAQATADLEAQQAVAAEAAEAAEGEEWLAEMEAAGAVDDDSFVGVATAVVDPELAVERSLELGFVVEDGDAFDES